MVIIGLFLKRGRLVILCTLYLNEGFFSVISLNAKLCVSFGTIHTLHSVEMFISRTRYSNQNNKVFLASSSHPIQAMHCLCTHHQYTLQFVFRIQPILIGYYMVFFFFAFLLYACERKSSQKRSIYDKTNMFTIFLKHDTIHIDSHMHAMGTSETERLGHIKGK